MKKINFKSFLSLSTLLVFLVATPFVSAETLFEGYYKVSQFKKHIGFFILKVDLDAKSKKFKTSSFLRLGKNGFDMTESTVAESDSTFNPKSYSYMAADGKKTKTIDVNYKNGKASGFVTEDGKKLKLDGKIEKGTFLSSALYYVMLNSKEGLKTGSHFEFTAVAEEMGDAAKGSAAIDKKIISQGVLQLMKVTINFSGTSYENLITDKGEVISSTMSSSSIETELVKKPEDATADIKFSKSSVEKIFGLIPEGKITPLHASGK